MKNIILPSLLTLTFSCTQNTEVSENSADDRQMQNITYSSSDLKVIEGIVLGEEMSSAYNTFKSYNIPSQSFSFSEGYGLRFYTDILDLPKYRVESFKTHHIGILIALHEQGTDFLTGIYVSLGASSVIDGKPFRTFEQSVCKPYLDEVEVYFNKKYGQPLKQLVKEQEVYFLEGTSNTYSNLVTDDESTGELMVWETKSLKISLFKGFRSYIWSYWDSDFQGYLLNTSFVFGESDSYPEVNPSKGHYQCNDYPFIKYELKEDVKTALGLNELKI